MKRSGLTLAKATLWAAVISAVGGAAINFFTPNEPETAVTIKNTTLSGDGAIAGVAVKTDANASAAVGNGNAIQNSGDQITINENANALVTLGSGNALENTIGPIVTVNGDNHAPIMAGNGNTLNYDFEPTIPLADGRKLRGDKVSGKPTVVIGKVEDAMEFIKLQDYLSAFIVFQEAINAYETTFKQFRQHASFIIAEGDLTDRSATQIYLTAAMVSTILLNQQENSEVSLQVL